MESKEKIWKDIPGYEGLYQISIDGEVKSLKKIGSWRINILKPQLIKGGYGKLQLKNNKKPKNFTIHRLVWISFNGKILDNLFILHKNEKLNEKGFLNNSLDNLWIGSHKDNMNDREKKGRNFMLNRLGKLHHLSKPIYKCDNMGNILEEYECIKDANRKTGIDFRNISAVLCGKRMTAGDFIWKYKNIGI